jgi:hypothetical protein
MSAIIKRYEKKYGYKPNIFELYSLYSQGYLNLSDSEENQLLREFKKNNIN